MSEQTTDDRVRHYLFVNMRDVGCNCGERMPKTLPTSAEDRRRWFDQHIAAISTPSVAVSRMAEHETEVNQVNRRKPMRRYRVEETLTIVGVAEVEATAKVEVQRMIADGKVEFDWNDGQDVRRGDGIKVFFEEFVRTPSGQDTAAGA